MGIDWSETDRQWMRQALAEAERAASLNEVPVGAVLVSAENELLATGHNQPISSHDPSAHAEIVVLRAAAQELQNYRLVDSTLYVTLEPCVMCVGALIHARVKRVVYGAPEAKTGAIESACQLLEDVTFNHSLQVDSGLMADECAGIMSVFFERRRREKKEAKKQLILSGETS